MTTDARPGPIELTEEQVEITKREVERGRIMVRTRVEERDEVVEMALRQGEVTVERVPLGVPIDAVPVAHEEDGVLIIPVVEEQLVVSTRLILKEEIRITRRTHTEVVRELVQLRSEQAEISRREGRDAADLPNPDQRSPSMTERTLTAMYDTRDLAESARDQLVGIGVARDAITIHGGEAGTGTPATAASEDKGFWASLADFFMPDEDRHTYTEGLKRGGYLLSARVPDALAEAAEDILESSEPIDLDERSASWRENGWAGYEAGTPSYAGAPATAAYSEGAGLAEADPAFAPVEPVSTARQQYPGEGSQPATSPDRSHNLANDDVVQVAEEELRVGKRDVGRGSVRVRSYVTERPVEEQVELRQERVTIERRPVDRAVAPGDAAFTERTIEAVERGEEAVVSKTARVTEEIGLRTDVEQETETVRDTVRKQNVEVEDERTGRAVPDGGETAAARDQPAR